MIKFRLLLFFFFISIITPSLSAFQHPRGCYLLVSRVPTLVGPYKKIPMDAQICVKEGPLKPYNNEGRVFTGEFWLEITHKGIHIETYHLGVAVKERILHYASTSYAESPIELDWDDNISPGSFFLQFLITKKENQDGEIGMLRHRKGSWLLKKLP